MANTYTQIHFHTVFAVRNRQSLISGNWETELYKYITGIIQNKGHKMLQINGMPDHIHLLFGMRPTESLSDLIKDVKQSSSRWINRSNLSQGKFSWQEGYGAFSHSKIELTKVASYIQNQKQRHQKRTFMKEYLDLLQTHGIEYDTDYLFLPIDSK